MKERFQGQKYINVETYRKSGVPVRTPVWFAEENGTVYVRTLAESGKVKRIRKNSAVQVAACKVNGETVGPWLPGSARLVHEERGEHVDRLLRKKYGVLKMLFDLMGRIRGDKSTTFAIQFDNEG